MRLHVRVRRCRCACWTVWSCRPVLRAIRQAPRPALRHGDRGPRAAPSPWICCPIAQRPGWLRERPVTLPACDRSTAYAQAIATGTPHATEVLGRWHPHQNICEAVERVLYRQAIGPIALPQRAVPASESDLLSMARSRGEHVFRAAKRAQRWAIPAPPNAYANGCSSDAPSRRQLIRCRVTPEFRARRLVCARHRPDNSPGSWSGTLRC